LSCNEAEQIELKQVYDWLRLQHRMAARLALVLHVRRKAPQPSICMAIDGDAGAPTPTGGYGGDDATDGDGETASGDGGEGEGGGGDCTISVEPRLLPRREKSGAGATLKLLVLD